MRSFFLLSIVLLASCSEKPVYREESVDISNPSFKGKVVLKSLSSRNGFKLLLVDDQNIITDQTIFQYTPYQLDTVDVNHDGSTDILVGLIKPTEFDPTEKKRLFILRIDDGQLRPLWLGSKVCQELVDFRASDSGLVRTLEKTKSGNYAIGEYEWQGFGLALTQYIHHEISFEHASQILRQ